MGPSNKLSCEAVSSSRHHNLHSFFQLRDFEALFPCNGTLGCAVCLSPQLFLLVYPHANMGPPSPPALPCQESSPSWLPVSAPPANLDECSFFNSLVVGFPYSLIFWQFWLFFVFKFVVVILLVVQGSKYIKQLNS